MSHPAQTSNTQSFFRDELQRALAEQTFGITGYALTYASPYEAKARVELLENAVVDVVLSIRGFQATQVVNTQKRQSTSVRYTDDVFETIDALLEQLSPLYSAKGTEALFSRFSS